MHTVVQVSTFIAAVKRSGLSAEDVDTIVAAVSADPQSGALIPGTGGARKLRFAVKGRGKSGGVRTIHYFGGADIPVFLITVYGKGDKANLTRAERNELSAILPQIAAAYRKGTAS